MKAVQAGTPLTVTGFMAVGRYGNTAMVFSNFSHSFLFFFFCAASLKGKN
jgi:hypothetical protein